MGISYKIDGHTLYVTFEGSTDTADILGTLESAFADAALPDECMLLVDASGSTSLQKRSSGSIQMLAEYVSRWADRVRGKLAVVVGKPVQYGLMRMASAYASSSGLDIRPFETVDEALEWLTPPSDSKSD